MNITFHGAAQTVTGSMYLIDINGSRVLLECGLYQGARKESFERNRNFPFDPRTIDAVILSHAHIDHSGNLPHLIKHGYTGPIYATPATAHLCNIMLLDSGHVQERQAEMTNRYLARRGEPLVDPLYTELDAAEVLPFFKAIPLDTEFSPANGVTARFVEAGHILGSAAIDLTLEENGKKTRLWFSGDIGRRGLPILRDPVFPTQADVLVMESTYGDKPHADPEDAYQEMKREIIKTLDRHGKVIIPAFAVGRTQELVYNLNRMKDEHALPNVPVYVDSPLAVNVTDIFKRHPECYDEETARVIQQDGHPALEFANLTYIRSLEASKALNERRDPMIIISASGMAEFGRIVFHIRWNIENPRNTILIVSWQAPNTLGRRLADREERVSILGDMYPVKANIATIGGLSAHAGQNTLVEYGLGLKNSAKHTFLVHGEERGALPLMEKLKAGGLPNIAYPKLHDRFEMGR
jgi:metallo-beta-lactamase family protein